MKIVHIDTPDGPITRLVIRSKRNTCFYKLSDLIYCKAERNYTRLHFCNGDTCLTCAYLSHIADKLQYFGCVMVHKSYLINMRHLVSLSSGEKYRVLLTNGFEIPVSIPKKTFLESILNRKS